MNQLLGTSELGKYIKETYGKAKHIMEADGISISLSTIFRKNLRSDGQGDFCFTEADGYHFRVIERGVIYHDDVTQNLTEITYKAVKGDLSEAAATFEAKNRNSRQDFRRLMFAKRLQLFRALGPDYERRAQEDIEAVLRKAPFSDELL